ncbi:Copine-9 [Oopsacas minuta]|uniref:Copine-9 n=1 Tax=Oopsacas minuta TaxID=111878 RepID=A0AAV7KKM2_9METZ|nr:Copine-9 [Oopsacas minuta]
MLSHHSTHPLSLNISLSEIRVRNEYSLISCVIFVKHSTTHEFNFLSATDFVENPGIGGFVTFHQDIRVEWLIDWDQQIRIELRTLELTNEYVTTETQEPLLVACAEFPLTCTLVAGKEFCIPLEGADGIQCSVLHMNTRDLEENKLTLIFKCSTEVSIENKSKRDLFSKLLRKEEFRDNKHTNKLHLDLATKYRTGVMQPFLSSELRDFSEVIEWDKMYVSVSSIKEFNLDNKVWIRLWQRDEQEYSHKIFQTCETLRAILTCEHETNGRRIELKSIQTEKGHQYINSSSIDIHECRIVKFPTAVDYLLGGHEISLTLAIDFTVSNGNYTLSSSYHHLTPSDDNLYVECIKSVINFTQKFSNNSHSNLPIIAYGFGAAPVHLGQISQCFALNQEERNPTILSSDKLWYHYTNIVKNTEPARLASLRHVIHKCLHDVMAQERYIQYRVCYVLTTGNICDMLEVKELLVESAKYPLSIVFIGVGDQKGSEKLEELTNTDKLISSNGSKTVRSNILYRNWKSLKFETLNKGQNILSAISLNLTSILLEQFRDYYRLMNLEPPRPIDTRSSPGAPYRSLTKQTSLYGHYVSANVSDIKVFQEAQLQQPPNISLKNECSIGHVATPESISLIKPIILGSELTSTPLSPQQTTLLEYSSYLTPLTDEDNDLSHSSITPLLAHEDSLKIHNLNIDD